MEICSWMRNFHYQQVHFILLACKVNSENGKMPIQCCVQFIYVNDQSTKLVKSEVINLMDFYTYNKIFLHVPLSNILHKII